MQLIGTQKYEFPSYELDKADLLLHNKVIDTQSRALRVQVKLLTDKVECLWEIFVEIHHVEGKK